MKIKEIKLNKFKRFTDLTITELPETAKLVILVGPNGCGKTSVFEGLYYWYRYYGFNTHWEKDYYIKVANKNEAGSSWFRDLVTLSTYDTNLNSSNEIHGRFYFRTAHRNEPDFTTSSLSRQNDPKEVTKYNSLMQTDTVVSENYQRLISSTLSSFFDNQNNDKSVKDLREELIGKIQTSLSHVFDDLKLSSIGDPLVNGCFYFTKGESENFHYRNLSAGEKSAFDLLLDMIIKSVYLNNTIYCIDEPETHMHTALQSKLIAEMYNLVPDNGQLWLTTHSIGMLKEAKKIEEQHPNTVCFLNFTDIDFDVPVIIKPSTIDSTIWNKFLELAFGDFSKLIAPERVVFCEGSVNGASRKNFDADIYTKIFSAKYPRTSFVSIGSCSEIEDESNISMQIISRVLEHSNIIKLVDRDDKSEEEVSSLHDRGIKVLAKRHIECYLLDDEIITKLCIVQGKRDKIEECLTAKKTEIDRSISRGNPKDDIKSASGQIYTDLKRILSLTQCGNDTASFLKFTMSPLITQDTKIYTELESNIFA